MLLKHVKMETILMILQFGRFSMAQFYRTGEFRNSFKGLNTHFSHGLIDVDDDRLGHRYPSSVTNIHKLSPT